VSVLRLPLAFLLGLAAAVALVACGGSNDHLLPAVDADRLKNDLAEVQSAVDQQDCSGAESAVRTLRDDLQRVPAKVSARLRRNIREGLDRLSVRVPVDCQEPETQTETIPTTTTETETTPTETQTTPTETETTPTTPTDTTPTTPTETTTTPTDTTGGSTAPEGGSP
jgi:hypothetical protein